MKHGMGFGEIGVIENCMSEKLETYGVGTESK